jgi:hypothetical protein
MNLLLGIKKQVLNIEKQVKELINAIEQHIESVLVMLDFD